MTDFKVALHAYCTDEMSLSELTAELERCMAQSPDCGPELSACLQEFRHHPALPNQVHAALLSRVAQGNQAGKTRVRNDEATVALATAARRRKRNAGRVPAITVNSAKPAQIDTTQQRPLAPGVTLKERFILEEVIGSGGMSVVFKARDLRKEEAQDRNAHVAIKVLSADFKSHPASLKVLQREAQKAQSLAHPNIATVYDFDRDGNTIFMTMEYLQGETLDKVIGRAQPQGMSFDKALRFIEGIVHALTYAHKKNIIHSDLKPGNVFYTKDNTVKVLDFGIARASKRHEGDAADFDPGSLGALTPAYASCEMLEAREPDPRDDVYALACIAYELLTGRHPFNKTPATQARDAGLRPTRNNRLTNRQWAALRRGLAFERSARTPDVLRFLTDLKPAPRSRRRGFVPIILLLPLLVSFIVWQYLRPPPDTDVEPPVILTEEQAARVTELFKIAKLYLDAGRLAVPPGDSAYDIYQQILEIDPRNKEAQEGIRRLVDLYEQRARKALELGSLDDALADVEIGLRMRPKHEGLQTIRQQINQRLARRR